MSLKCGNLSSKWIAKCVEDYYSPRRKLSSCGLESLEGGNVSGVIAMKSTTFITLRMH